MKTSSVPNKNRFLYALALLGVVIGPLSNAQAVTSTVSTFGTVSFDQANTPNQARLLGNGETLGGVTFSAGLPTGTSSSIVNFPTSGPTFDTSLSLGRLTGLNATGSRAVNLPNGDNGSTTRHGIEVSWNSGLGILNGTGDDFVIFESASAMASVEGMMVRVHIGGTDFWSDWYYYSTSEFNTTSGAEGLHTYKYDLSNFGLTAQQGTDAIQFANLKPSDRIVGSSIDVGGGTFAGEGKVVFDSSSSVVPYAGTLDADKIYSGTTVYDPDPLYVASLRNIAAVPEPTTMALVFGGMGLLGMARRKRK